MAITNFIPQVWSARLQDNLHKALVFGSICNRNYEGDIAQWGDTVHINTLNDITVKAYNPQTDIAEPEQITGTDTILKIDHGAYYNFYINDVDGAQARADLMDAAMRNAAHRLAVDAETYILEVIRDGTDLNMQYPMASIEGGDLYQMLLEIKVALDTANVPRHDRKLIIPPLMETYLLMDSRFITGSAQAACQLAEGSVARALGFDIYISMDLENEVVAMIPDAVTFANQITKVEAYRPEKGFCDGLKGLCLSGAKVLMPTAVLVCKLTTT